jgi:D-beta-D-heptose 7-phosphate kinase/D-beta-D-heptose 1-phosphate adenosyltransferase
MDTIHVGSIEFGSKEVTALRATRNGETMSETAKRIVLVTGGFDPLHRGHIAYLKEAKKLGDMLIVGLNSDEWLERKKGLFFMQSKDRRAVLEELSCVNVVIDFDDKDGTAKAAIKLCLYTFPDWVVVFANGGDRAEGNIPEMDIDSDRVEFVFGVGGTDKKNSSSWILEKYKEKILNEMLD